MYNDCNFAAHALHQQVLTQITGRIQCLMRYQAMASFRVEKARLIDCVLLTN